MIKNFPKKIVEPSILVKSDRFIVKVAENHEEIEAAQRLRYEVFNIEQGRGLRGAEKYGIDFDEFDEYCLHLIAIEKESGKVVGTYRAHLGCVANSAKGFYSSKEYEIRGLYSIADKCLELGRTCVSADHRSGVVIALLWSGIAELLVRAKLTYMLGCVSLDGTDPRTAWAVHEYLSRTGKVSKDFMVIPRPGFKVARPPRNDIKKLLSDEAALRKKIPPIFKGYLRLGGRICGEPALDREFGTIDFFVLVDVSKVPARYKNHFNYRGVSA
ncbi:MAG: GNAT family N-acetyltransferase [Candidatus Omnitrophica bacterium]|nr:GNAT family N-acetyltransferase [Candidatus Omnitrophota bacterium]